MNNKLEELSRKLDNEIAEKKAQEIRSANARDAAIASGTWGAIKYGIGYGFGGFIVGGIVGLFAGNTVALIIFFLSIIIGGFVGYSEES